MSVAVEAKAAVKKEESAQRDAAIARAKAMVMDLLRLEARNELASDAESAACEGEEVAAHVRRWYGHDLAKDEHTALVAKRTVLEFELARAKGMLEAARIRGDSTRKDWRIERDRLSELLSTVDTTVWELEQRVLQDLEAVRAELVEAKALQLYDRYNALSQDLPFNVYHPAITQPLRRWYLRQQARGAFAVEEYRLFGYLVLRDTVFTGVWNVPPVLEDDELPVGSPLELAGRPTTKTEARMQKLLDQQFMHENGDRRIARDTGLTALHAARVASTKEGHRFNDRLDLTESDYWGLPTLVGLQNPALVICADCGAPVQDFVVKRVDVDGEKMYQGQTVCDCGVLETHTEPNADYQIAFEATMRACGRSEAEIATYRKHRAKRRVAA